MRKRFLNRDYRIFRQREQTFNISIEIVSFKNEMFRKFLKYTDIELFDMFCFSSMEAATMLMEYHYNILFTNISGKSHIVIGKDENELLDFFLGNAPYYFEEMKRLNHLQTYMDFRERINEDFETQISTFYTKEYKERKKRKDKRKDSLGKLLDI